MLNKDIKLHTRADMQMKFR